MGYDRGISAEDRLEVLELVARYNWACDTDDAEALVATYAPDGEFVGAQRTYHGPTELREFAAEIRRMTEDSNLTMFEGASGRSIFHNTLNVILERKGNGIRLLAQLLGPRVAADGTVSLMLAWYDDELVQVEGEWRFARRQPLTWTDFRPERSPVTADG